MSYCERCGTQIPEESGVCPKCCPSVDNRPEIQPNQQIPPKKKFNKMIVVIPSIIILTALITFAVTYFVLPSNTGNEVTVDTTVTEMTTSADYCPASDYGNHDWSRATCQEPSYCYDCNAEKDGQLGNHNWDVDDDGTRYCWDCGLPYDDYTSLEE